MNEQSVEPVVGHIATKSGPPKVEQRLPGDERYNLLSSIVQQAYMLPIDERQCEEQTLRGLTGITANIIEETDKCLGDEGQGNLENFNIKLLCLSDNPGPFEDNIPLVKAVLRHFQDTSKATYDVGITEYDRIRNEGIEITSKKALPTKLPQLVFIQKTLQFKPDDIRKGGARRTEIDLVHQSKAPQPPLKTP